MKPEETVDYNIKVAWHAISRMYNAQAAKHDITTSIGFVLLNIDQENGTPATKIAPLLGLETRSLTRILRSMEEKLPSTRFMRIHRSYIVSLDHVRLLDGNTLYVQDKLIPVSDTYREALYRVVRGG